VPHKLWYVLISVTPVTFCSNFHFTSLTEDTHQQCRVKQSQEDTVSVEILQPCLHLILMITQNLILTIFMGAILLCLLLNKSYLSFLGCSCYIPVSTDVIILTGNSNFYGSHASCVYDYTNHTCDCISVNWMILLHGVDLLFMCFN